VSHRPERKEKDCLNCGVIVQGRYCHLCGQQNVEPKETFWELVTHFIYDLTHFDGNFFSTLKLLLFKPGFLSLEYMNGRRMRYLNPIRMYIFISAFFFLFFFSIVKPEDSIKTNVEDKTVVEVQNKINKKKQALEKALNNPELTPSLKSLIRSQIVLLQTDEERLKTDTTNLGSLNYFKIDAIDLKPDKYSTPQQYDSLQATLPPGKKDNWIERRIAIQKLKVFDKYGRDTRVILNKLLDKFFHSFPQMLFVSLPLFALLLQLLYIRRTKKYYYVDHVIYSIHLYCAMFFFIFINLTVSKLEELPYMGWLDYVDFIVAIYMLWYIYKSMRKFYGQSRSKTIFKYILLFFISSVVMSFLFMFFFIFSAFTI
jgi:hypothetical protein